jgi:chromosomal replication initiation ATPase DnaA
VKRHRAILRDLRARHLLEPATRIAERHHVALAEVLGRRRHHPIACARHELWAYAYEIIPSYPLLGEIFDRDHSTILCGVRVHRERIAPSAAPPSE